MELVTDLADDRLALIGCACAFVICGGLMSLSYYLGRFLNHSRSPAESEKGKQPPFVRRGPEHARSRSDDNA